MHPKELEICYRTLEFRYNYEISRESPLPKARNVNGFSFLSNEVVTKEWLLEVLSAIPLDHLENECMVAHKADANGEICLPYGKNKQIKFPIVEALWCIFKPSSVDASTNTKPIRLCSTPFCLNPLHLLMTTVAQGWKRKACLQMKFCKCNPPCLHKRKFFKNILDPAFYIFVSTF